MDGRSHRRRFVAVELLAAVLLLFALSLVAQAQAAPLPQDAAQGKALFDRSCAGCHTIGGGRTVGPDLKGVSANRPRDWLVEFIATPDRVIARGDPTATQLLQEYGGVPMPNLGITPAQAADILAYIDQQSGGGAAPAAPAPVAAGQADVGRALFDGSRRLAAGGPPCIGCHNAAGVGSLDGGSWGLDLTKAHSKFGAAGISSLLKAPAFPGMREAYLDRPLNDGEIADLTAFLAVVDQQQPVSPTNYGLLFPVLGLVAFVVLLGLSQLAWQRRLRSVRKPLLGGKAR
jgi:mono/diheme cytochrome c family protein